jgi:hypothetical protein
LTALGCSVIGFLKVGTPSLYPKLIVFLFYHDLALQFKKNISPAKAVNNAWTKTSRRLITQEGEVNLCGCGTREPGRNRGCNTK